MFFFFRSFCHPLQIGVKTTTSPSFLLFAGMLSGMNSPVTLHVFFCENVMSRRKMILKLTHLVCDQLCSVHTNTKTTRNCPSFNVCRMTSFSLLVCAWHETELHMSAAEKKITEYYFFFLVLSTFYFSR